MSKKVLILVEGRSEEGFVKQVLSPYLLSKSVYVIPKIIITKKVIQGPDYKGGISSYSQVKRDIRPLLNDTSADIVTTMIDYYALPIDFPGYDNRPQGTCYSRVQHIEDRFNEDINNLKFIPYLQLHEFEALVFACEEQLPLAFINLDTQIQEISAINKKVNSPEEINDNPKTAPSKRLENIFPEYQKVYHSQLVLSQSNIDDIRSKCPHFNSWLSKLEN